jgi:hypothetical protein
MAGSYVLENGLSLDEFFCLTEGGEKITGRGLADLYGFNPDTCKVVLVDDSLLIFERGRSTGVLLTSDVWRLGESLVLN